MFITVLSYTPHWRIKHTENICQNKLHSQTAELHALILHAQQPPGIAPPLCMYVCVRWRLSQRPNHSHVNWLNKYWVATNDVSRGKSTPCSCPKCYAIERHCILSFIVTVGVWKNQRHKIMCSSVNPLYAQLDLATWAAWKVYLKVGRSVKSVWYTFLYVSVTGKCFKLFFYIILITWYFVRTCFVSLPQLSSLNLFYFYFSQ